MSRRPVFLTFADFFLPGYKAGGPIRAIDNLSSVFAETFQFDIVTRDRDLGDDKPYAGVRADTWVQFRSSHVHYLSPGRTSLRGLLAVIRAHSFDAIYLNSFFSSIAIRVLILRRLGFVKPVPVVLAPRGEFSLSALKIKSRRKRVYIAFAKFTGLLTNVIWQASSGHEVNDINALWKNWTRSLPRVELTPEMLSPAGAIGRPRTAKKPGYLEAATVLRISDNKNLDGALRLLQGVRGKMKWCIYGPIEDERHWEECKAVIATLPDNISVHYEGTIPHESVPGLLADKHLFFFPTFGENFGHAIIEALEAGCPVLISDKTPWRDLERHGVGWDIPLNRAHDYQRVLEHMIDMGEEEHNELSRNAIAYVAKVARNPEVIDRNREFFASVISRGNN